MLTGMLELLHAGRNANPPWAVPAFNVIGLEHAEAIVRGAEAERAPVILQISQNAVRYRLGLVEPLAAACVALAASVSVPVALHLDHATTRDLCERAARAGAGSIMFDASTDDDEINVVRTREIVGWARGAGVAVEGEIGVVGGKEGTVTTDEGLTDPDAASRYVAATGVDVLAIAVGTEHGMTSRRPTLDLDRISAVRDTVDVPLVLHGSSGVPDDLLVEAVRRGITKVNVATRLNVALTGAIRQVLTADARVTDPRVYGGPARVAVEAEVRAICRILGSSGKA